MKERPEQERPYELCEKYGPGAMSDAQLLAAILRSGVPGEDALALAGRILYGNGRSGLEALYSLSLEELKGIRGIGRVKAVQLKCIGELSKRIWTRRKGPRRIFGDSQSVADYYMESMRHLEQENVLLVMLDVRNAYMGDVLISQGTVNASLLSPREVFVKALAGRAVRIVLLHNHPSGDPSPSAEDVNITEQIARGGELIQITLLDHIIIGDGVFFSFRQEGLL